MNVVIVKYNAGNTRSMLHALRRLGVEAQVSDDAQVLRAADRVIFPGVGEASTAMQSLRHSGLDGVLPELRQPFLGVCLGLQLLGAFSAENSTRCLSVFDFKAEKFPASVKVPHMGWNALHFEPHPLFAGVTPGAYVYFVHSYYVPVVPETVATADYPFPFSAAVARDNFYALQFHPEKSGETGARILKNFLDIQPGADL